MKIIIVAFFFVLVSFSPAVAFDVYTTDFIDNDDRSNFNSFENLPDVGEPPINDQGVWIFNDPSEATYNEDGIVVTQIFDEFEPGVAWSGVWTTHFPSHGARDWYPNGGDDGYTILSRLDGSDFVNIGFDVSSGVSANKYLYILLDDGQVVDEGWVEKPSGHGYLGFSGGGFDQVLVRSSNTNPDFFDQTPNGLGIDEIELSNVPEPSSIAVLMGLALVGTLHRRRKT